MWKVGLIAFLSLQSVAQSVEPTTAEAVPPTVIAASSDLDQIASADAPPSQDGSQDQGSAQTTTVPPSNSVLKPNPGGEVIKSKDLYDRTGYFHPFVRMPKYFWQDQKAIWTSPFHTSKSDAKWWLIWGGATAGLIASDKYVARNAPDNPTLRTLGNDVSYLGQAYTLIPIAAGFYFAGTATSSDHLREAGLLSFESLADVTVLELVFKSIADRQRPMEGGGSGRFEASSGARYSSSFPSGHAIVTFAMASVFAHEYPHNRWVQILAYAYAGGVVGARMAANMHFPGDVLAGGAMGWFTGDYVYGKRHNSDLEKPTLTHKILSHVQVGFSAGAVP